MNRLVLLPLPLLTGACIDYNPGSTVPGFGIPNPRPLEEQTQADRLVQVTVPTVDILWVIDNSCSMGPEQTSLAENSPIFLNYFLGSGLDYHIGTVSTDMFNTGESGKLIDAGGGLLWLDPDTPDPDPKFRTLIELGNGGGWPEKGLDAAYVALEERGDGFNSGFERDISGLHMIAISDEYDHSEQISAEEFSDWLTNRRPEGGVSFSSISPLGTCPEGWGNGTSYHEVTDTVGGVKWNVCNDDWGPLLEALALQASGSRIEYFLSELPVIETIEVWVVQDGVTLTMDMDEEYTYDETRNSVRFVEFVPEALAEVWVEYTTLAAAEQ